MILYYNNSYDKKIKTSHELLEAAIADYLGGEAQASSLASDSLTPEEQAKALVAELYKSTEYGKPAIPGFAEFSISHSETCWAVLIDEKTLHDAGKLQDEEHLHDGASLGCGLDIQFVKDAGYETVCRKYYTHEEQEAVALSGKSEFFRLWARREALVKTVGTTIVNRGLPSVLEDRVSFEGSEWIVKDLTIPGLEGAFAAMVYSDRAVDEEVKYVEIA